MQVVAQTPGWIWSSAAVSVLMNVGRVLVNRLDIPRNRVYMAPFVINGYPGWALPPRPWDTSEWRDVWYFLLGYTDNFPASTH